MGTAKVEGRRRAESAAAIAEREAAELVAHLRVQLTELSRHLSRAERHLDNGVPMRDKHVAKLRLIADDLSSATRFAAKLTKD